MGKLNLWKILCFALIFCAVATIGSPADTFTTLASFNGTNGTEPFYGTLVQGSNGNLYGTTSFGGTSVSGTVFQITPAGDLKTIHSFDGGSGGAFPQGGLGQAPNGVFYGTTQQGGTNDDGTIFKITPAGTLTTLHSFDGTDGSFPRAGLLYATNGKLYGTTVLGGTNGDGTLFSVTPAGTLTTLHSFDGTDGAHPYGGLIQSAQSGFYGTTADGGTHGGGTVFTIKRSGKLITGHNFCSRPSCADGANPYGRLIQASDGNLYGTTRSGGHGEGTVFEIPPTPGKLITLYKFCSQPNCTDGANPYGGLIQASDGNFYGTTSQGGSNNAGTIFEITSDGTLSTLYSFCSQSGCDDGETPFAGLVQATNGNFYGTTNMGGTSGKGTVFNLVVGLRPFVEALPTSAPVGKAVTILGYHLAGATSVTFNGTPATFTVSSSTKITTTVPSGATTGPVTVTIPGGTLTSNVSFIVG